MFWDSNTNNDMETYQRISRTFSMETCEVQQCSPVKLQEMSMYEPLDASPSRMSCDGDTSIPLSPLNCSFTLRRRSADLLLVDQNTQDSGYSPSEHNRVSPSRRQISFGSMSEDCIDLFDLENDADAENQSPATAAPLPDAFSRLISSSLAYNSSTPTNRDAGCELISPKFSRPPLRRALSVIGTSNTPVSPLPRARNSLFGKTEVRNFKRPEPPNDGIGPMTVKRCRMSPVRRIDARSVFKRSISNQETIISAVHRSSTEPDLIGDFTKAFCLPLIAGRHSDLKSVSAETLCDLLRGGFADKVASFQIIDCRYPYEFEAGHIEGAKNLYTREQIMRELVEAKAKNAEMEQEENRRHILIFHCEFSSERGPNLSRFLRSNDRRENKDYYPFLHFPELYLLDGGYKNFFETFGEFCTPNAYVPMLHPEHEESLKYYRAKSKTFNADAKPKSKHRL